jgi:hypothetical protein
MTLYWTQGQKRIAMNLGSQFATLGAIVLAFINILKLIL